MRLAESLQVIPSLWSSQMLWHLCIFGFLRTAICFMPNKHTKSYRWLASYRKNIIVCWWCSQECKLL